MAAAALAACRSFHLGHHPRILEASRTFLSPHRNSRRLPFLLSRSSATTQSSPQAKELASPNLPLNVIDILQQRGLIESITNENLRSVCSNPNNLSPLKVYCGFDPTAESLHLGNLLGIIVLSWFIRCGHKTVALLGGATGRVGDPSGKSLERPELDIETIEKNCAGIGKLISTILGRSGGSTGSIEVSLDVGSDKVGILEMGSPKDSILNPVSEANRNSSTDTEKKLNSDVGFNKNAAIGTRSDDSFVILNNYDWWKDITLLDFLREVGRFARVGTMMAKESVKKRLTSEEGMSYTEFTYQLLQGYDFLYLFKNMGVNVQIGGSDQWGNITAGTELIRKILQVEGAYGLTFPLLLKSDGTKFGKSEGGAIWLSQLMLSPYKFYQYFFSVPDVDVVRFLKILTFLSIEEIQEFEAGMKKSGYVPNTLQSKLAEEVTRFVHGEEGLAEAMKATEALRPGAETQLDWQTIEGIAEDIPSCSLAYDQVLNSSFVDLTVSTGLLSSKSAARRMVKQGGLYLNNKRVDTDDKTIEIDDIVDGKVLLLSAGKKNKMVDQGFNVNATWNRAPQTLSYVSAPDSRIQHSSYKRCPNNGPQHNSERGMKVRQLLVVAKMCNIPIDYGSEEESRSIFPVPIMRGGPKDLFGKKALQYVCL